MCHYYIMLCYFSSLLSVVTECVYFDALHIFVTKRDLLACMIQLNYILTSVFFFYLNIYFVLRLDFLFKHFLVISSNEEICLVIFIENQ